MASEHESREARGASTEAKGERPETAQALRDTLRHGLVVAVTAAFRVGDGLAAATERPRESARAFLSAVSSRAGRVAGEARAIARRAAEDAAAGDAAQPEPGDGEAERGRAKGRKRRPKRTTRS